MDPQFKYPIYNPCTNLNHHDFFVKSLSNIKMMGLSLYTYRLKRLSSLVNHKQERKCKNKKITIQHYKEQ